MANITQNNGEADDSWFTRSVINSIGERTSPRLKHVLTLFIKHSHSFLREAGLTTDEFMAALQMINWAGQMTTERRNEGLLLTDVIGLER